MNLKLKYQVGTALVSLMAGLYLTGCGPAVGRSVASNDEPMSESQGSALDGSGSSSGSGSKQSATNPPTPSSVDGEASNSSESGSAPSSTATYSFLDPKHVVPKTLLDQAVAYYDSHKSTVKNKAYMGVIDFSKRSTDLRFHIISMKTGDVWSVHVAHGKGTDPKFTGWADPALFSNKPNSEASSLGYYLTAETYSGVHGYSLRLDGLSTTNSNARARAIVIHGAAYVHELSVVQGRSWGCPALDMSVRDKVIDQLKNGALIFAGLTK